MAEGMALTIRTASTGDTAFLGFPKLYMVSGDERALLDRVTAYRDARRKKAVADANLKAHDQYRKLLSEQCERADEASQKAYSDLYGLVIGGDIGTASP